MSMKKAFNIALATRSMNKADLARRMNCTPAYIAQISKGGCMSLSKLAEVCGVLDYKLWEFLKLGDV